MNNLRNFCIIAHIDHGKSTLADRLLEFTHTVERRQMKEQLLDQMDLERERGITIKLQPVRMNYELDDQTYILNLIDTPGHVDFSYEVSRSLACCEAALLVVDSTQGIEAQTLANAYLALEHNLTLIPVVNKIDLPNSDKEKTAAELIKVFGFQTEEILYTSGKTGEGVDKLLREIVKRVNPPVGNPNAPLRALIFDSQYDVHRGVVAFIKIVDGSLSPRNKLFMLGSKTGAECLELGYFKPKLTKAESLKTGEVGYVITGLRDVSKARVGDTITLMDMHSEISALDGYKLVTPMVYASIFPVSGDDYPLLRDALNKLKLSDSALVFEPQHLSSVGFGFRTGFLGLLHMEIVQERLHREYNLDLILTAPSVAYEVVLTNKQKIVIHNPAEFPDPSQIQLILEPWVKVTIISPSAHIGSILDIVTNRRGLNKDMIYLGENRVEMAFEMPLAQVIIDFYDVLKSASSGYASLNYEFIDYRAAQVVKVEFFVAGEKIEALSVMLHRSKAESESRLLVAKLKEIIPRQQFEVSIQAAIGGKFIARETLSAMRKDVTGYLYGGDVTRKMKLLNKQKRGKKRMKKIGKVDIPQEAFLAVLKRDL